MSKKIVALSASPRKGGNSDVLCDEFLRGAREAGHTADKIFLRDKTVHPCLGCEACAGNGGVCVQRDDMAAILDAMSAADVIVLASPVYFYSMNAQMKAVIDRTVARYTAIKDKEFYFIATAADTDKRALERTMEGFRGYTDCLPGAREKGALYGTGLWKKGDVNAGPFPLQAREMGRNV